jgi:hypothetical protein
MEYLETVLDRSLDNTPNLYTEINDNIESTP